MKKEKGKITAVLVFLESQRETTNKASDLDAQKEIRRSRVADLAVLRYNKSSKEYKVQNTSKQYSRWKLMKSEKRSKPASLISQENKGKDARNEKP